MRLLQANCKKALVFLTLLLAAPVPAAAQNRLEILAVNYPLAYFAGRIAGNSAKVSLPVPAGRDPTTWRPEPADIEKIQTADLILLNGAGFASWTKKASLPRSRVVDTSRGFRDRYIKTEEITHSHGADGKHSHAGTASFTWLDFELAGLQAIAIATALKKLAPEGADDMDARLAGLIRDLKGLASAADALSARAGDRLLVASHPRYQYFARAYGLTIISVNWEAGVVPSPKDLRQFEKAVAGKDRPLLIWEKQPPAMARSRVADLGVEDTVFPTLAEAPGEGDLVTIFASAIADLAAALD